MRAVLQRVSRAKVTVDGRVTGEIGTGLCVLLGVEKGDASTDVDYIATKVAGLRVFSDSDNKLSLSVTDAEGKVLVVSQFTLLGDVRKGRRPSFDSAEAPEKAKALYEEFVKKLKVLGVVVAEGEFQAHMELSLVNDGPVTILLDSRKIL
jgi:D-tyrosyl-tRNA(Tyr) deacylase